MNATYTQKVMTGFEPDPEENVRESLFKQYEHIIVESLISSFGLDFLIKDQHGGDVDTIHNVRLIETEEDRKKREKGIETGKDPELTYKNKANQAAYESNEEYNSNSYHSHSAYKAENARTSQAQKEGNLTDAYTGKKIKRNESKNLDHVISAKEINDDPGRVLAGLRGEDLANSSENLKATNESINKSKKQKSASEFTEYLEKGQQARKSRIKELKSKSELDDTERKELNKLEKLESVDTDKLKQADKTARDAYEKKLAKEYYTSPQFMKDMGAAAAKNGAKMGARQALGLVFAEIWFAVKEEFSKLKNGFKLKVFFTSVAEGIKKGIAHAKEKFGAILSKFFEGALAGALSSITTTLCNIFLTTAKNVVKIIRQTWASIVQAFKVLFFNPEGLSFRERMKSVAVIIATGASIVFGTFVTEAISKSPIGQLPIVGGVASAFCGALVSGILSCTLVHLIDKADEVWDLFKKFDPCAAINKDIEYYKRQSVLLDNYAAQLMELDIDTFRKETAAYNNVADLISNAKSEEELHRILLDTFDRLEIEKPYEGSFDDFMEDEDAVLVFK